MTDTTDLRRFSPSIARNRDGIRDTLAGILKGQSGQLLEIGSGTGEHSAYISPTLKRFTWQPSDAVEDDFTSILAWRASENAERVADPIMIDCLKEDWAEGLPFSEVDVIFSANVIHITPPSLWPNLIKGAAKLLKPSGLVIFYGPFRRFGEHTSPSNAQFDLWLAEKDPSFAVRDWEEIASFAKNFGLEALAPIPMPANNFIMQLVKS